MKTLSAAAGAIAAIALLLVHAPPGHAAAGPDLLVDWNAQALAAAQAEDRLLTLKGVRTAALMHLAIHDALNCTERRYRAYGLEVDEPGADAVAAATEAAYMVLLDQYPQQRAAWQRTRAKWLDATAPGAARDRGIALGAQAAAAVLARRSADGWNSAATYQFQPMAPGVYAEFSEHSGTPQGFVFGAGWAAARPFALRAAAQFRSPPPPAVSSAAYARAFNEVKDSGRFGSRTRTADQTHLALWWKDFVESSHNRLARQLVTDEHTELWSAARMFALLNMGIFDAYISAFDNKFFHNHWRPYTAIRQAEHDGNPATVAEPDWNNTHRHTYAFPSYPSAHGTACAAAMTALADTFGDRHPIRMSTPEVDEAGPMSRRIAMQPAVRAFDSFSAAAMECALSRVYLGIHFRYDSLEGNRLGTEVGRHVTRTQLTRMR
jgi:membrane-associated phospholipid phosphatase